ncbi:MAG: hypothetical protein WC833_14355 [Bacteroidales bacterium]|jgi:hypothetical protein
MEAKDLAASVASRVASLAVASAYTHPLIDAQQTKHIVGPCAYAALAIEIMKNRDQRYSKNVIRFAIGSAQYEICLRLTKGEKGRS